MGENICKRCDRQGVNFQKIQTAHTTQYQKTNKKQTTQSKNGQKTLTDISPKQTHKWPSGT